MPALVAFNRKWLIGSDDFVYPGFLLLLFRLAWFSVVLAVFAAHQNSMSCPGWTVLNHYYVGVLVMLPLEIALNTAMVLISMRGSIADAKPRRLLPAVLYAELLMLVVETGWNGMASYWVFGEGSECELHMVLTAKVLIVFSWCTVFCIIVAIAVMFDTLGSRSNVGQQHLSKLWRMRCKFLCCSLGGDQSLNNAFAEVADIVSEFFQDVDLVPTDIAVGLGLIYRNQRKDKSSRMIADDLAANGGHSPADGQKLPEWMNTKLAAHYMKYALASYGWPMYAYSHLPFGCCGLCCLSYPAPSGYNIMDDRCCLCNLGAIQKTVDLSRTEIVYASFRNELYENPFFIGVDHEEKAVVVAIRGTLSLKDAVVDINAMGAVIDGLNDDSCQGHKGMLRAAMYLKTKLETSRLLQSAFSGQATAYKLVLTGHSLGAGVAALLAILMKPSYPDLQCFSFSPPGGLLSPAASNKTKDWIMSVVVGDDLVPRLSLRTMAVLKGALIQALSENRKPKYKLIAAGCWHVLCGICSRDPESSDESMKAPFAVDTQAQYMSFSPYSSNPQAAAAAAAAVCQDNGAIAFGLPGHILFIGDHVDSRSNMKAGHFMRWLSADHFDMILVSQNMGRDHMPNVVLDTLSRIDTFGTVEA